MLLQQISDLAEHEKAQLVEMLLGSDESRLALGAIATRIENRSRSAN